MNIDDIPEEIEKNIDMIKKASSNKGLDMLVFESTPLDGESQIFRMWNNSKEK